MSPDEFFKNVIKLVLSIPKGKVATYGQIGQLAGKKHGARGVSFILHSSSRKYKLPWQRVINASGGISFDPKSSNFRRQINLLKKEGIVFSQNYKVDLKLYQWRPDFQVARAQPCLKARGRNYYDLGL